ncbi:TonB-dependent receptor [Pseudohalioglobus sediminis]|uniref:TonB-dependent receptor n=1 Tax=Pseudohalioglobus sediminis TaxID=2606449 RepID=A0A5B0X8D3_9GAMM|nr:TonB-dependent receptor [Pseudohalioglobus sediminis]KAA1194419.1 TonB-dependent receptor [Pseudohalioglobus sediminis]
MSATSCWRRTILASVIPVVAIPFTGSTAIAQDLVLEEIIVTARKRVESLQETPVAVTALSSEALREQGVRNLADINTVVPNIEVAAGNGNAGLANIYIRGVGQRNSGANIDSGVGIYIDGVYVGRPDGALLDINDIQSVQVLRGPQGTLFGKNTTGGALVFTSNRPQDEFEGMVGLRVGNYDRLDADLVLNVPLTDSIFTRLSATHRSRDGYVENLFDGDDYIDEDRQSVMWQTRWLASEDLTLDLNLNWGQTQQTARPQKCVKVPGYLGWQEALFDVLAVVPSTGRNYADFCADSANAGGGDPRKVISDLGSVYEAENMGAALTAEWALNDDMTLKSISAWRYTEAEQNDDLDNTAIPFLHRTNSIHPFSTPAETDQYSQEFQLVGSAFDDRLQYVGGLYWFKEETDNRRAVTLLGPYDPAISNLLFISAEANLKIAENEAWAVFSQVEWEFNDHWRATLGVRYTDEDRTFTRELFAPVAGTLDANGGPVIPVGGGLYVVDRPDFVYNPNFDFVSVDEPTKSVSNSDVTPMASLQYLFGEGDVIDYGSLYLTYSEGFLSGGLSEAPGGDLEEFEPEEVENIEFGFKLDMLDRRLRVNGAIFHTDYTNRQLTTLVVNPGTGSPAPATINAKSSTIQGIELETTWLAAENWLVTFNAAINDGDIEEFDDVQLTVGDTPETPAGCSRSDLTVIQVDECPNDRSDENLPRLPEESYMLAVQYSWQTSWGLVEPRLQASWKFDIDYCFDSASCRSGLWLEDKQYDLSARVTWFSPDGNWTAALWGSNLTEEDYIIGGGALVESQGNGGIVANPPRMYGAEVQYRF